ncbi:MAG: flagellar basal body rod protein FlgB [Selenomonas sp.]|jgi:flagellar basal-body rod protein FlgB|uniref:flagellar basal body rod protein FlgB n=1 Tax=Selenomonas sp. AE3005 TaxID=1485543 RepID=UPI0004894422|nr:flagellar basal body rod protein FlgB [Selenomonas sp. AE3005]MBQ1417265.1 flagellar basal body rod protein FlgB [Selenomonas sp.]MBQ1461641.1 flagellar basal body rod protein FlgB [Selenomonas sp.]MBQ1613109.1 flagellar basal body rod protein FlgB [Selenomonas sp.]MBQ1809482.1 flagellar basal body rod protein FlgB [Selenomonas sp.]MBQ1919256.1 flagellar basal body rod protein FlgB [Selenomonas sp.]
MLEQIMNSSNFDYLSRGMSAANLRQEVISNNIANVNTPHFKRSAVNFEDLLAKELHLDDDGRRLDIVRTHDRHLPIPIHGKVNAVVEEDQTTTMRVDDNNVDIDIEMAALSKNQLYYNAMATQLGGFMTRMKNVITSGQS